MDELDLYVVWVLMLVVWFQLVLDGMFNQMNNGFFCVIDEVEIVEVMINGYQWFIGLCIEDGLLKKLGVEVVVQWVNEVLYNVQVVVFVYNDVVGEQLIVVLLVMFCVMNEGMV